MMDRHAKVLCTILCLALSACALADEGHGETALPAPGEAPIVNSPKPNSEVGPSTLVVGKAAHGSLIVIYTQVFDAEDDAQYSRPIPGHRHRVNPDGSFALLIATPRTFLALQRPVRYEINVYAIAPDGTKSPHTVIPVKQAPPQED